MHQDDTRAGFRIRTATPGDLGAVDRLLRRSYPKLLKADYPPSTLVLALPGMIKARPSLMACGTYYVAEGDNGQLLGAGGWTRKGRETRGDIRHVVTDPLALRQGIGRALMQHSFAVARANGLVTLECWATRTAVPFYKAVGFEVLGPMEVTLGTGVVFPAVRMERAL
ncbi:GNAT family N-acetyltransferase [Cognatishimia sp. MH4019]|uniref:GNAT family N-acetyltransferase n=1 Tax=Cognatishimia sp. MH4019 TaxID=2854030 RepID=UPI001CD29882|nr:GNAT family N-acetyltransferase [Cognatishimia sp. MH4019]